MKKIVLMLITFLFSFFVFSEEADFVYGTDSTEQNVAEAALDGEIDSDIQDLTKKEKKVFDIPRRIFEIGFDANFGISNNYFATADILKKELEIDLRKIADEIDPKGLSFDFIFSSDFFMNLNLKNGVSVGLSSGIESSGNGLVSKEVFEFLGYGNDLNETISVDGNVDVSVFAYTKTDVTFFIKNFRVNFGPAVFFPLVHVETSKFDSNFLNSSNGAIQAEVVATYKINSCMPLESFFENEYSDLFNLNNMDFTMGFDLSGSVEHQIFETLMGRAYMRLPIVPGSMGNAVSSTLEMRYGADDLFDMIKNDDDNLHFDSGEKTYSKEKYWISRPFRTGAEIAWRPFGKCVKFGALLGFGVKYPWTGEAKGYIEYEGSFEASLFNILGINLSTAYMSEIFIHQAGFMLNCRVLEFDFGVSAQGANLEKSFKGSGFGAYTGIRIGW